MSGSSSSNMLTTFSFQRSSCERPMARKALATHVGSARSKADSINAAISGREEKLRDSRARLRKVGLSSLRTTIIKASSILRCWSSFTFSNSPSRMNSPSNCAASIRGARSVSFKKMSINLPASFGSSDSTSRRMARARTSPLGSSNSARPISS